MAVHERLTRPLSVSLPVRTSVTLRVSMAGEIVAGLVAALSLAMVAQDESMDGDRTADADR